MDLLFCNQSRNDKWVWNSRRKLYKRVGIVSLAVCLRASWGQELLCPEVCSQQVRICEMSKWQQRYGWREDRHSLLLLAVQAPEHGLQGGSIQVPVCSAQSWFTPHPFTLKNVYLYNKLRVTLCRRKKKEYNSCNSFNTMAEITGLINIAIKKIPLERNCLFSEIESIVQERIFYSCALSKEQINHISSPFLPFYGHRTWELQGEPGSHLSLSVLPMQRCVLWH